jgi:hypothetical protein
MMREIIEMVGAVGTKYVDPSEVPDLYSSLCSYGSTSDRENTDEELRMASEEYGGEVSSVAIVLRRGELSDGPPATTSTS